VQHETYEITPNGVIQTSDWVFKESDWMVLVDGITGTACEFNRKTGERRSINYDDAIESLIQGL
jgi:hypothetical protein